MSYKGFIIDSRFRIYKKSKLMFTASWQHCYNLEAAMAMIDHSEETKLARLPDKQAALKKLNTQCELESGSEKRDQEDSRMNNYFENHLNKKLC